MTRLPLKTLIGLAFAAALASPALAKLPTPAPSPEAAAKAAETAARTAWTGKVDAYQLCQAQDRVAARYRASPAGADKPAAPALPPCVDPGPFAFTPPEQKPIEAAGAHSPPGTATSPPSTTVPAAAANPAPKAQ